MHRIDPKDLKLIVTGGAQGIGAATVRMLAAQGAKVLIADILDDKGEALAAETGALYCHLDVTKASDWTRAVAEAEHAFGGVNALFNNAGILGLGTVLSTTPKDFARVLDINLTGAFLGIHITAPAIAKAGGGAIVNTSSTAGLMGYGGLAAYTASKWGLRGLTKAAALDLAPQGIRIASIHPGGVRTPMTEGFGDETTQNQPIPRFAEPEEIARMVRFILCEASFSTGSEFVADGGTVTGQILTAPDA
ncbi:SDR family oxidoreductase [Pararhodobacter sp.]|uniref:SDR family oxidoreductase n=1 Tax=Pararhodobacter sp. TaxID=2127056 RepID=UPI002AFEB631|nr:SDR family oxidoreductase [Pararhodobacter sp.]